MTEGIGCLVFIPAFRTVHWLQMRQPGWGGGWNVIKDPSPNLQWHFRQVWFIVCKFRIYNYSFSFSKDNIGMDQLCFKYKLNSGKKISRTVLTSVWGGGGMTGCRDVACIGKKEKTKVGREHFCTRYAPRDSWGGGGEAERSEIYQDSPKSWQSQDCQLFKTTDFFFELLGFL